MRAPRGPAPLALALFLHGTVSPAHGRDPEVVTLEESADAVVTVGVRVDDDPSRVGAAWSFALSPRCRVLDAPARVPEARGERWRWRVDCGPRGLDGVTVDSLGSAHETVVTVRRRDGAVLSRALRPAVPAMVVPALGAAAPTAWETARGYLALGAAHLATGVDHLLFLALLLVRVRGARRRAAAVSAFTAGHAVTLALAALTAAPVSSAWVEALIAGSVWLLAADTWSALAGDSGPPARRASTPVGRRAMGADTARAQGSHAEEPGAEPGGEGPGGEGAGEEAGGDRDRSRRRPRSMRPTFHPSPPCDPCALAVSGPTAGRPPGAGAHHAGPPSPWALPAAFGLVHGLGFAGALRDAGLPPGGRVLALASFNAGIELAQLAAVLAAVLVGRALGARLPWGPRAVTAAAGVAGAWWLTARVAAMVSA